MIATPRQRKFRALVGFNTGMVVRLVEQSWERRC